MTNMQAAFARALEQQSIQPVVEAYTPTVFPWMWLVSGSSPGGSGRASAIAGIDGDKRHREEHGRLGARIIALSKTSEDLAGDLTILIAGYKPRFRGSAFVLFEIMEYLQRKGSFGESPDINAYCTFLAPALNSGCKARRGRSSRWG